MIKHFTDSWAPIDFGDNDKQLAQAWHEHVEFLDIQIKDNNWTVNAWKDLWNNFCNKEICLFCNVNVIIGFSLVDHLLHENSIHLWKIVIDSKYRMKGLGSKMLSYYIENYPGKSIFLEVSSDNLTAIKCYESMGFKKVHLAKGFYSTGKDAWKMVRS